MTSRSVIVLVMLALLASGCVDGFGAAETGEPFQVALTAQQGRLAGTRVAGWHTLRRVEVTCGASPSIRSPIGNNGVLPAQLCQALRYYPAHSSEARCSYLRVIGPIVPRRVQIDGTINGHQVNLSVGLVCNSPARLGAMTGRIYTAAFGFPYEAHGTISEATLRKLTRMAHTLAKNLADPRVHRADLVLTTRHRMNTGIGIGYQASQAQDAKVFVIQIVGRFTCDMCSHPSQSDTPTGNAAQDVLSDPSLNETDFGLTSQPFVMQRMGPVMVLHWK